MRRALPFIAIAITLLGLAASAASLADSLAPAPAFCAESGCETVRASAWAKPLGIPLPIIGVAFFSTLLLASLLDTPRARRAQRALVAAGGLGALGLLGIQAFAIGTFCELCLVADVSALLLAPLVLFPSSLTSPRPPRPLAFSALALGALAIAAPLALSSSPSPPPSPPSGPTLPDVIAREQRPGVVTIVDYIDFECPFCRALHGRLTAAIEHAAKSGTNVRVVRKMVPLAIHDGALPAAIAWCCAEKQGKGDAMAEALIAAPTAALTPEGCAKIAASIGCDMEQYRLDAASADIRARIERDIADARAAGVRNLPTIYINAHAFIGAAASVDDLVAAIARPSASAQ